MINSTVKVHISGRTVRSMKGTMLTMSCMDTDAIHGLMERSMRATT